MNRFVYCIRHGTALHNVMFKTIGRDAYTKYMDTCLVAHGVDEAKELGKTWKNISDIDVVLVSPLTRTLETAKHIFKNHCVPIIAYDCLMEHPQAEELCNLRIDKQTLIKEYPFIDFSNISNNHKVHWSDEYDEESEFYKLKARIETLRKIINNMDGQIAIVSHSSFLGEYMFNKIGDENNELRHCYPYKYEIN